MAGYENLGWVLGDYQRGYRILAAFSATGRPEDLGPTMVPRERSFLANNLALFADRLGRLAEAWAIRQVNDAWNKSLGERKRISTGLQNSSDVAFARGRLTESHALGDIPAARADFVSEPLGDYQARHHLDLGELAGARALCDHGIEKARKNHWKVKFPLFHALLARIDLAEGGDPTQHLDEVGDWTSRTGDMRYIIEAHLFTARHLLARGDPQDALGEAEAGLSASSVGVAIIAIDKRAWRRR